nr:ubiquitin carboxyl-terminal hydrolase 46 [Leptinotarsa decemlineata]
MGANISQLERDIGSEQFPCNEHYFGLVNFGNTCYSNSVLQALYFCKPFREKVLEYKAKNKRTKETLLTCLADLFHSIATQKKKVGSIAPKKFIARLRKEKEEFDNYMQQDAHEFLNFLINHISEIILAERQQNSTTNNVKSKAAGENGTAHTTPEPTWVHEIFQVSVTRFTESGRISCNLSDDAVNPDRLYDLVAVVIHCGSGPNRGHYISIVKSHGFWLLFDDDQVDKIDASTIEDFYGLTADTQKSSETGYILFYQSRESL